MAIKSLYICFIFIFLTNPTLAQTETTALTTKKINVAFAGSEPFVFTESNSGISVDIWQKIVAQKSWDFKHSTFNSVDEALHQLNQGKVDIVIGPISITTNRLENMVFSQPFYNSSISIISRLKNQSIWQKIKPFFSVKLLMAIGVFLIILAIVGTLLWLAERKKSPEQFSDKPLNGIGTGMWLAIVTMSTTGYGDKAPVTLMGRIIAGSWMVISLLFATTMVAGIASTLTISNLETTTISNIDQLSGRKTATILGSSSETFLNKTKARVITVSNLEEAILALENKEVDAVVFDRPQLLYYLKEHKKDNLYLSKAEYYKQGYGFAFPENSPLITDVNLAIVALSENQELQSIIHTYMQKDE